MQDDEATSACSVFDFREQNDGRLHEWLRRIPQDNLVAEQITDNMGLCERHFDPRFIVRDFTFTHSDGCACVE